MPPHVGSGQGYFTGICADRILRRIGVHDKDYIMPNALALAVYLGNGSQLNRLCVEPAQGVDVPYAAVATASGA
jgi:hypothetical protein